MAKRPGGESVTGKVFSNFAKPIRRWLPLLALSLLCTRAAASPPQEDPPPPVPSVSIPQRPPRIGVILPLTGKFSGPGNYVLDGIKLAISMREEVGKQGIVLEIRDDGGVPEQGVIALQELAAIPEVVAVIGPLNSNVAPSVAQKAVSLQIPLISLSQKEELTAAGEWVFTDTLGVDEQVMALAEWAVGVKGIRKVAILYPETQLGGEMALAMRKEVTSRGGEITSIASYPPEETDLRRAARRLVGTEFKNQGAGQKDRVLPHLSGIVPPQLEGGVKVLRPGVDFEAVFVPDGYKRVSLVGPALVYEEVDLGDTFGRDKPDVLLLAPAAAHHPDLVKRGGRYLLGTVVADALALESPDGEGEVFVTGFKARWTREPGLLEAFAYEVTRAILFSLDKGAVDRKSMREKLVALERFPGVAGMTGFTEERNAQRALWILEAVPDGFRRLGPPFPLPGEATFP